MRYFTRCFSAEFGNVNLPDLWQWEFWQLPELGEKCDDISVWVTFAMCSVLSLSVT